MHIKQHLKIEPTWQTWITRRTEQPTPPRQEHSGRGLAVRTGLKAGDEMVPLQLYMLVPAPTEATVTEAPA